MKSNTIVNCSKLLCVLFVAAFMAIPHPSEAQQQGQLLPINSAAPDFTAMYIDGSAVHLSDYHGQVVVLDFWASWCGPCNRAMPDLEDLYEHYRRKGVVVLGLNVWDTSDAAYFWIKSHPEYKFTFAIDPGGRTNSIGDRYNIYGIPTTYVIDTNGNVVFDEVCASETDLANALNSLIGKGVSASDADDFTLDDDEMMLAGKITKAYNAADGLEVSVVTVTMPDGSLTTLTTPRLKTILPADQFVITDGHNHKDTSTLTVGTSVYVIGKSGGTGKPLTARLILIPISKQ